MPTFLPLALPILWRRIPWWHRLVAFGETALLSLVLAVVVFAAVVFVRGGIVVVVVRLFALGGIVTLAIIVGDRDRVTTRTVLVVVGDGGQTRL
jgi:hypothetical protein